MHFETFWKSTITLAKMWQKSHHLDLRFPANRVHTVPTRFDPPPINSEGLRVISSKKRSTRHQKIPAGLMIGGIGFPLRGTVDSGAEPSIAQNMSHTLKVLALTIFTHIVSHRRQRFSQLIFGFLQTVHLSCVGFVPLFILPIYT